MIPRLKVLYEKEGLEEYYIEDDVILETIPEYICVVPSAHSTIYLLYPKGRSENIRVPP